jgi:hypothetical protein
MPSASDTAYPRPKTNPSATELGEIYAPNIFELVFAAEHTRKPALQVGLLLLLKTFQRLGYFVRYIDIPAAIISHIARRAGYQDVPEGLNSYDVSTSRGGHMTLMRNFVGVTAYGYAARKVVVDASLRAARTREDLPDIMAH